MIRTNVWIDWMHVDGCDQRTNLNFYIRTHSLHYLVMEVGSDKRLFG